MTKALIFPFVLAAAVVCADGGPGLFFSKTDLPALRERVRRPRHAVEWRKILDRAEAYLDPKNSDYTDPAKVYARKGKSEYMTQQRYDAVLPHEVGRMLTTRMEALGLAYQITGEKRFGQHGARILAGTCRDYPVTQPAIAKGFAGGRGDIMYGLALGLDMVSDCLTPEERAIVMPACRDYLDVFVREFNDPKVWWYRVHNYNGVNGGAAGCLALTLRGDYPVESPVWVAEARKIVERWLSNGFDEDGAGIEGVGYAGYGMANSTVFGDALRRNGMDSFFNHPLYQRFPVFLAMSKLPGERVFDARNDSNYTNFSVSILKLAEATGNGLYRWLWDEAGATGGYLGILWDNDVKPVSPTDAGVPLGVHFRGRGLCVWRTGWGKDAVMFSTEAGPYYPTTHNQAEKGHFTLYGLGYRWATDPGYANEHEKEGRGQAQAHSCVLIDGAGQALSGAGYGTNGKILAYRDGPRSGYALVDAKEAYTQNNRGIKGAGARRALRHTMFVYPHAGAPAYAVLLDDIEQDDAKHQFTWQMMISSELEVRIAGSQAVLTPFSASGQQAFIGTPWTDSEDAVKSVKPESRTQGTCKLAFDVTESGEYALWARVRTRASERAKADSFFVRVDDGKEVDWHMPGSATWVWGKVAAGVGREPFVLNLKSGKRVVTIRRREPGAEMDCLLLLPVGASAPTMVDAPSSPLFVEAESGLCDDPMRVDREPVNARLELHLDAAAPFTIGTDIFSPKDYHGPASFPRLRAATTAVNPAFAAVLLPLPEGAASPVVSFGAGPAGRRITVEWGKGKGKDEILWPDTEPREPVLSQLR